MFVRFHNNTVVNGVTFRRNAVVDSLGLTYAPRGGRHQGPPTLLKQFRGHNHQRCRQDVEMPGNLHPIRMGLAFLAGNKADPGPQRTLNQVQPLLQLDVGGLAPDVPWECQGDEPLPGDRPQPLCRGVKSSGIQGSLVHLGGRAPPHPRTEGLTRVVKLTRTDWCYKVSNKPRRGWRTFPSGPRTGRFS